MLIYLTGLPASGKSTWAKNFVKEKLDWVIINRDSLRNMRGDYWIPSQELLINKWEEYCVDSSLKLGLNVIVDATNLSTKSQNKWIKLAKKYTLEADIKTFDTPLETCIDRDSKRDKPVGKDIILNMYKKYIEPKIL